MLKLFKRVFGDRAGRSHEEFEDCFENGSVAMHWAGPDGMILRANAAELALLGYARNEYLGRSIRDFHLDRDVIDDMLARLARNEILRDYPARLRCKDRSIKDVLIDSSVYSRNGEFVHTRCFTRDVTDRRRDEQELAITVQRLEALYHLADAVGRAKETAEVCEVAVSAIMAAGPARASVLLFDEGGVMRFRAWRNLSDAYRAAVEGHSPWSPATRAPQPVVVEDVLIDSAVAPLRDVITAEGIRALAFIPLVSQGHLLGKFMIYYDAPHTFSDAEMRLAASIAQHVAFGLARVAAEGAAESARTEADERRNVAEELARLARTMNETLDVASVGERIVEAALTPFRVRASALRLAAPDGSLVGIAFAGAMKDAFAPGHTIPAGPRSVSGLSMTEGSAIWSDDAFADPRLVLADDIREGMRRAGDAAVLAVPLRHKGRVFGALSVADRAGRRFSAPDAALLQAFADQAALAIENARLFEEAKRRQREAEVGAEITERINASLDLSTTLERLVEGARELCDGNIARIVVRDPGSGRMVLRHQVGVRWTGYHQGHTVEPGAGSGGIVLLTGKPFRTESYTDDPRITSHYREAARADGTVAQVVVPIPGEAGIGGLLYVDRTERRPFSDAEEAILVRLADHAGTAIRNSQLFAAEQAARAEADAANHAKDRFLAMLSHELRTPLTAILGWARLLTAGTLEDRQRAHAASAIERNARLQSELIADLVDVSRIAAGKMEIDRVPVDLALIVGSALEAAGTDFAAKRLHLVTELDPSAGEVLGDARRLQQIVANLLSNAVKFTPEGGEVRVRLVRHETCARLSVADTGEGIDPVLLPRVFDPFEQGDGSTTRKHQGLGLGLAIVWQLVQLHGGTVHAESRGKGAGATFTVDLPVLAMRAAPLSATDSRIGASAPVGALQGFRVMVVDDQADARELISVVLRQSGAEVRLAASVSEALEILAAEDVDLLVSDIAMPDADGYALIEAVRMRERERGGRAIRAVALTAHTGREVRERALGAGFDAHATKPLEPQELITLLVKHKTR